MTDLRNRQVGGFGLTSERSSWAVAIFGILAMIFALVMVIVGRESAAVWLSAEIWLAIATAFAVYCGLWYRKRRNAQG